MRRRQQIADHDVLIAVLAPVVRIAIVVPRMLANPVFAMHVAEVKQLDFVSDIPLVAKLKWDVSAVEVSPGRRRAEPRDSVRTKRAFATELTVHAVHPYLAFAIP